MSNLLPAPDLAGIQVRSIDISGESWGDADVLTLLPADEPSSVWLNSEIQLVGWGEAARYEVSGPERFSRAQRWWLQLLNSAIGDVKDRSEMVAFVSFAFDPNESTSVISVPKVLISRHGARSRLILLGDAVGKYGHFDQRTAHLARMLNEQAQQENEAAPKVDWPNDESAKRQWSQMIDTTVGRINAGELDKVVLARAASARADKPIDPRWCLRQLREMYPRCWVFKVDDLVGATPELLVSREGDAIASRVLAGTIHPQDRRHDIGHDGGDDGDQDGGQDGGHDGESDAQASEATLATILLESAKDLAEHEYAVNSVANALANHCTDLQVPKRPSVLALGNVSHLATDVTGQLADDVPALILAASLHPTAAVCGTPTERALTVIAETEVIQRRRYAGPVGWLGANGDGEIGIALRCAEISGSEITAYAGCGLVGESVSEQEWQESEAKLRAIKGIFAKKAR